jgi:RND family efflux transporter MFP subunit
MTHPWLTFALCSLAASGAASCADRSKDAKSTGKPEASGASADARKILFYRSPMNASFISTKPGKDAMGMDLVPVREGDPGADLDAITLEGATIQRMGVRIAPVKSGRLTRIVRAFGRVDFDETRVATVNMKFDGWIEKLWVSETGQFVKRGSPLFAAYSPELVGSQEEYAQILKSGAAGPHSEHLAQAAKERLLQFDVPAAVVDGIEKTGTTKRQVVLVSPVSGYVVHKTAFEGTFVKKGANLFTIADLDALWVLASVYESDAPWVVVGQEATVELSYMPGHIQEAKVDYVYPVLDKITRTVEVRLLLPNPKVALKPGMFTTVRIHTQPTGETLLVPIEAVIRSGERSLVFVSRGNGRFEGRDITLGVEGDEDYEVLSGLAKDDQVVTSGQFLLDSESHLREAVKKMLGSNVADPKRDAGSPGAPPMEMGMGMDMRGGADAGQAH